VVAADGLAEAQSQAIAEAYAAKEQEIEERYAKWEQLTEA